MTESDVTQPLHVALSERAERVQQAGIYTVGVEPVGVEPVGVKPTNVGGRRAAFGMWA